MMEAPNHPITPSLDSAPFDLQILDPANVRLFRALGATRLTLGDERSFIAVQVARAFPVSDPNRWIGFLDGLGNDIGMIQEPSKLDAESRLIVEEEIELRYFVPIVRRVIEVKEEFGTVYWTVETDRGEAPVIARNLRDNTLELPGGRVLITDVDGNRFKFPPVSEVDPKTADLILRNL